VRRRLASRDESGEFGYIRGMQLTVNGEALEAPEGTSVLGLVKRLGLDQGPVAVERNREVVPRAEHESTLLRENDVIEIVHFVGGG
jgi:sulfur carrier protein